MFELNFMSSQPASGYYQFTVAVTGDSRLVANQVEVSLATGTHKMGPIESFKVMALECMGDE